MKIKEITSSLSATVPTGAYENLKPGFEMKIELSDTDSIDEVFKYSNDYIKKMLENFANNAKIDLIEKQYQNIRFYECGGKKYPSVTSILGWNTQWKITEDELSQYASRGTIVHKLIELYLKEKKWYNPIDIKELQSDVNILMSGSKGLTWADCSYQKALENIIEDIEIIALEQTVINEEHLYGGRLDLLAKYKGRLAVIDFKSGTTTDLRQLSAYAVCLEKIEDIIIVPVGVTDNKSGFKKPIVSPDITKEFKAFLKSRASFRERFGV